MICVVLLVDEFENCPLTYALFSQNFCCQSNSRKSKVYCFAGETSFEIILFKRITGILFINVKIMNSVN